MSMTPPTTLFFCSQKVRYYVVGVYVCVIDHWLHCIHMLRKEGKVQGLNGLGKGRGGGG